MKCVICHGNEIKVHHVYEELPVKDDIIRIPIQVPVCENCGEKYYDRKTIQKLEKIREKIQGAKIKLKEIGKVLIYED